jgi:hypothetical protein
MKGLPIVIPASIVLIFIMLAVALYVPNSLPAGSDFSAIYNTDLALVNGVPIYDLEAVEALAVQAAGIPPEKFFLARFPYPPWYALSTFYLGLLPAQAAAALWFEINLVMLFLSIWFLTDGWDGRLRLIAFPLALFFIPVLGALSVGQYDFPVLLGASFLIYSLKREDVGLTTLGVILLTFKPHVGALVLVSALGWLIGSRGSFKWRALRAILIAGIALFLLGFLADAAWIVRYPAMLLNYQGEGNVSSCSECASLPVYLSRWFFDGSLRQAVDIALVLLVICLVLFHLVRKALLGSHASFLSAALLVTLLVSPYLYNYDFILLLAPFAFLLEGKSLIQKLVVAMCYLVPSLLIVIYGRAGNISLLIAALILMALVFMLAKRQVDASRIASYNTTT